MFEEYQNAKDYAKVYRGENVMKRGIATYQDEAIFLSQDTLHRDMETLKGRPVVIKHQNVTPENMEEKAVGYVTDTFYNNEAGTFGCKFVVFDDEAKELIKNGYGLSTCYKPTSFGKGGTEINTPYDREVTGLNFTHLALVPDPRYEDVKIYENGVMEMEEEKINNTQDNAIIEEQERDNTMENEKMEIPVTFFDKIMDLICNSKKEKKNEDKEIEDVIEEKEEIEAEDEKENKCKKNEVVDKRDILRQIMAIAGKHEDNEDVRTIAKLAEKLAYDKDEAEKENSKEDLEYNNDEFFNAMEIAKSLGESDKLPIPETQAKQLERGKQIFG